MNVASVLVSYADRLASHPAITGMPGRTAVVLVEDPDQVGLGTVIGLFNVKLESLIGRRRLRYRVS